VSTSLFRTHNRRTAPPTPTYDHRRAALPHGRDARRLDPCHLRPVLQCVGHERVALDDGKLAVAQAGGICVADQQRVEEGANIGLRQRIIDAGRRGGLKGATEPKWKSAVSVSLDVILKSMADER